MHLQLLGNRRAARALVTCLLFAQIAPGLPVRASDDAIIEGMSEVVTGGLAAKTTPNGKSWEKLESEMQRFITRLRTDQALRDQLLTKDAQPVAIAKKNGFEIDDHQIVSQMMIGASAEDMEKLEVDNDLSIHFSTNPDLKPGSRIFYALNIPENGESQLRIYFYQVNDFKEEPCCRWNWKLGLLGSKTIDP